VAIVRADFDESILETLAETVRHLPDYTFTKHGQHELHAWTHGKGSKWECALAGAYVKPDLLIIGASTADVTAALDVLDGAKPNIVGKGSPLAYPMPIETLFLARAVKPWTGCLSGESPILNRSEWLELALFEKEGEKEGKKVKEAFLTGVSAARDHDTAEELKTAIDAALTTELTTTGDADVADVINTLEVFVKEKYVSVDVHGAGDTGYYLDEIVEWLVHAADTHVQK
jgi:hypothetical protein